MRPTRAHTYKALGCLPFQANFPSFALPIFERTSDKTKFFVQEIDEVTNLVGDFKILGDTSNENIVVADGPSVSIGSDVVYAFIDELRNAQIGSISGLTPSLRAFVQRCPDQTAVILQIEELIGEPDQKRRARAKMREAIKNSIGDQSAYAFYEVAVLRAAFWQLLIEFVKDADVARRIISVRSRLGVEVEQGGTFKFDLRALSPEDQLLIDTQALAAALREQFDPILDSVLSEPTEETLIPKEAEQRIDQILQTLSKTGRQEERVAIILDEILKDRDVGLAALQRYKNDRGQWANSALKLMELAFAPSASDRGVPMPLAVKHATALKDDQSKVATLIQPLFSSQYTLARGEYLYCFALHLSKWPKVNSAIRSKLNSTRSVFVDNYRKEIIRLLEEGVRTDVSSR